MDNQSNRVLNEIIHREVSAKRKWWKEWKDDIKPNLEKHKTCRRPKEAYVGKVYMGFYRKKGFTTLTGKIGESWDKEKYANSFRECHVEATRTRRRLAKGSVNLSHNDEFLDFSWLPEGESLSARRPATLKPKPVQKVVVQTSPTVVKTRRNPLAPSKNEVTIRSQRKMVTPRTGRRIQSIITHR
ncbi:hypothetical protein AAMO2058_001241500 [Amorphochlora amoebiformis]